MKIPIRENLSREVNFISLSLKPRTKFIATFIFIFVYDEVDPIIILHNEPRLNENVRYLEQKFWLLLPILSQWLNVINKLWIIFFSRVIWDWHILGRVCFFQCRCMSVRVIVILEFLIIYNHAYILKWINVFLLIFLYMRLHN